MQNSTAIAALTQSIAQIYAMLVRLGRQVDALHECLARRAKSHYTVGEVAEITGRSEYTVRRWITEGRIDAIRVADTGPRGKLLIPNDEIVKLIGSGRGGEMPVGFGVPTDADRAIGHTRDPT